MEKGKLVLKKLVFNNFLLNFPFYMYMLQYMRQFCEGRKNQDI